MWVARDKDGSTFIFEEKPVKDLEWQQWCLPDYGNFIEVDYDEDWFFPEVKWEDEEPTELVIKKGK